MATHPSLKRQIQNVEDMKRSAQRSVDAINHQIKQLERQDYEAKRLPNAGRVQGQLRDQVRQKRRDIDRLKQDMRTFDRQLGELRRMGR